MSRGQALCNHRGGTALGGQRRATDLLLDEPDALLLQRLRGDADPLVDGVQVLHDRGVEHLAGGDRGAQTAGS